MTACLLKEKGKRRPKRGSGTGYRMKMIGVRRDIQERRRKNIESYLCISEEINYSDKSQHVQTARRTIRSKWNRLRLIRYMRACHGFSFAAHWSVLILCHTLNRVKQPKSESPKKVLWYSSRIKECISKTKTKLLYKHQNESHST